MSGVRPTKRCLDDLDLSFPKLTVPLYSVQHALVAKAQRLPEEHESGGAERILSISDRLWFKVKVGEHRGAAGRITDIHEGIPVMWWLVAGGQRRGDSKNQDFYSRLQGECEQSAKGTSAAVSSKHLSPADIDYRRFINESTALGTESLKEAVREAICHSAHSGKPVHATASNSRMSLSAWVKTADAETYLIVGAEGFHDANTLAILLSAIPGMAAEDWVIEPGEVLGVEPAPGQLVYSAMIPPESLAQILEVSKGGYW